MGAYVDADVEATAEGSQHGSWLRDLRLNDHGLQQHYARRPTFRGTTYSAAHALVTYLQSAPLLTMSNNDELRIARVTNVTTITRGADEYVDKVTVTTGDGGTETFDFASFVDGVTLQANLNEMTSTLSEKMDADVIVECLVSSLCFTQSRVCCAHLQKFFLDRTLRFSVTKCCSTKPNNSLRNSVLHYT